MSTPTPGEVLGTIGEPATLVAAGSDAVARLPAQWRQIVDAGEATDRRESALELWGDEFPGFVPRFARALRDRLLDVRACLVSDEPALSYLARTDSGTLFGWLGRDPRSMQAQPLFWDVFPSPLRAFLRHVHAGFTAGPQAGFGPVPPAAMQTIAELAEMVDTIPTSDVGDEIATDRLLVIATDGGLMNYCVAPDAPGKVMKLYEGDLERRDFGPELDDLMTSAFRHVRSL